MTYMGGAVSLWVNRANQAWGDSRQWNVNTSFETDRNYWRDTVAHGDADVWNTRYNAGYNQATIDKQPPAAYAELTATGGEFLYGGLQNYCSVTVNRSGYWYAVGTLVSITVSTGILLRFNYNGSYHPTSFNWRPGDPPGDVNGLLMVSTPAFIASGQQITFAGDAGGTAARTGTHFMRAIFIPTQAYPH